MTHAAFLLESCVLDEFDGAGVTVIDKCGDTPAAQLQEWVIEKTSQEHSGEWRLQCAGHDDVCTRVLGEYDSATKCVLALVANSDVMSVPPEKIGQSIADPVCNTFVFIKD